MKDKKVFFRLTMVTDRNSLFSDKNMSGIITKGVLIFFIGCFLGLSGGLVYAAVMAGGDYSMSADIADASGWWHSRDGSAKGYWAISSVAWDCVAVSSGGGYELSAGFGQYKNQHYVYQAKLAQGEPTRTGPNSFGFNEDGVWEWQVPVKSGLPLTITAYIRYNSYYGTVTKPKLTIYGKGITTTSVSATAAAENAWELLTINAGTPSQDAVLKLKAEGFSTNPGARFYIDDIKVSQQ